MATIETDYLVVGAGASGMAFVDALLQYSDAEVMIVDRRHRPGGHWHDAYPFVRLHQPAAAYGVASTELGRNRIDAAGDNAGMYELSSAPEICSYFQDVLLREFLPTGRVTFEGMTEFREELDGSYTLRSLLSGEERTVKVRKKLIDATYIEPDIPARRRPAFEVDDDVSLVTPNDLVNLGAAPTGFTVIGAGKTAMDVCTWLLEQGVDSARISWVRSRDAWYIDREWTQPLDLVESRIRYQRTWAEAAASSSSGSEMAYKLEEAGLFVRLDTNAAPTAFRGATISGVELDRLKTITRVVRKGRVQRLSASGIHFGRDLEERAPGEIYVDCTATGLRTIEPRPVFESDRINIQYVTPGYACWSAATLGVIEGLYDSEEVKNRLSLPVVYTGKIEDLHEFTRASFSSALARESEPTLGVWSSRTRLNPARGLMERLGTPAISEEKALYTVWRDRALKHLADVRQEDPLLPAR